jgi:ectoine hydroxylase
MDPLCANHLLTETERDTFERDGYLVLENTLPPDRIEDLLEASDEIARTERAKRGLAEDDRLSIIDFIGRDERFLDMIDYPLTFPKIWDILSWNVQIYHTHLVVTPPAKGDVPQSQNGGWHQDSGRINQELEGEPRARVSIKVVYFLSDCSESGMANFRVIPGSHIYNTMDIPKDRQPDGWIDVLCPAGGCVFFDRRVWHRATPNHSAVTRKALFYGYSYRWLRPRDDIKIEHMWDKCDPVRRQLLGATAAGAYGYSSQKDEDVPLRGWIRDHLGESAVPA